MTEGLFFIVLFLAILVYLCVYLPAKDYEHQQAFHAAMMEKFECDRCGRWFPKDQMTYMACEGLFCVVCTDIIQCGGNDGL